MMATIAAAALSVSGGFELSILAKATVMLALGLAAARLAGRAQASVRHLLLAATFAGLLALPLLVVAVPSIMIRVPVSDATRGSAAGDAVKQSRGARPISLAPLGDRKSPSRAWTEISWPSVARSGWFTGTAALLLSLTAALWRMGRIRRAGIPRPELRALVHSLAGETGIHRAVDVDVLEHEAVPAPLTCGLRRPAIMLPTDARNWDDADVRRALVHELEHVRRRDWPLQLAARAVCACYWFHPLVWIAWRRFCLEAERACDDAVVRSAERTDYADQLVLLARRLSTTHAHAMLGMANRSDLSARVSALLDDRQRRGRAGIVATAGAIAMAGVVAIAIAPVRAVAIPISDTAAATGQSARRGNVEQRRVGPLDRALYEAADIGDVIAIDVLLQAGANVNCAIAGDGSPLIAAARGGRAAVVRHLLDRGADPNMPVLGDGNPIIAAAAEGAVAVVALLLDRGASIDQVVDGDENALIQASGGGHLDVVKLLVARGANVNARVWADSWSSERQGEWRTPLSMAQKGKHSTVAAFLIAAGARE